MFSTYNLGKFSTYNLGKFSTYNLDEAQWMRNDETWKFYAYQKAYFYFWMDVGK